VRPRIPGASARKSTALAIAIAIAIAFVKSGQIHCLIYIIPAGAA
jgi:hypothetical protein